LFAALCVVHVSSVAQAAQTDYGQITMENTTGVTLDLYVDGAYAGTALKGLFCTSEITAGTHTLEARTADGRTFSTPLTVESGGSYTWTIREEE
jgi:hypothetical protein